MKYMDIKPPASNATEDFQRWMNKVETELRTSPWYRKRKIKVQK